MAESAPVLQRAIPLSSPEDWKQALSGIPHSFFHTWEHSYAMHLTHKLPAYLYCAESDGVRVVCPFIERPIGEYVDIATPYGFSGFAGNGEIQELPLYWDRFVRSRGYVSAFIALHPLFFCSCHARVEETHELKGLYFLDLTLETEELLRRCSEKRRLFIRKWEARGISIVTDRPRLARFVIDRYQDFFRRKNAGGAYNFSPATFEFLLSLPNVLAIGAARGEDIEAFHLTTYTRYAGESLFYFDIQGAESRCISLIWEAAKRLRNLGISAFSLGGGLADGDTFDEFKRRFGGERRPLRALKQVIRSDIYSELCGEFRPEPSGYIGYFPEYRS